MTGSRLLRGLIGPVPFTLPRIGDAGASVSGTAVRAFPRHHARVQRRELQVQTALECLECDASSDDARGWKAFVDDEGELLVYCAACADREFGE